MKPLHKPTAEIFIPDGQPVDIALKRSTHMAIAAHQDDIEIMAADGILQAFQRSDRWFTGVVVTDGRGSPREGTYKNFSDEEMRLVRLREQKKAALLGEYSAQVLLDYSSKEVKNPGNIQPIEDIASLIMESNPEIIYTHNPADKHDTHVAVALKTIQAIRSIPPAHRPIYLYGCEVWRNLDWLVDTDKVIFDVSARPNLQAALLGLFDSQITGGKRYDQAALGRRITNATFSESHTADTATGIQYAMDLTPLITDTQLSISEFIDHYINNFHMDVYTRIQKHLSSD